MLHLISMNCTKCENDLLASYDCIECSENICEQCFDENNKRPYFESFSNLKTVKK